MSDVAPPAVVFLHPVEEGLGECKGCPGETDERRGRPSRDVGIVQVHDVQGRLDDIEERWENIGFR